MNPYDFVHIDLNTPPILGPYVPQDRFSGITGKFSGTITLLTPTFIRHSAARQALPLRFAHNGANQYIIPGSSLKGMFRSVVETVGNCWWWFYGSYSAKFGGGFNAEAALPGAFRKPANARLNELDAACRMFGLLGGRGESWGNDARSLAGSVGFEDAICTRAVEHPAVYTPIHDSPKPRHSAWYAPRGRVAGRKFYFHHKGEIITDTMQRKNRSGENYNSYIKPLGAGSEFAFEGHFTSLQPADLSLLLYAIILEPGMRHKVGFAKATGLGSIEVRLTRVGVFDQHARYVGGGGGIIEYTGETLSSYLVEQTKAFISNRDSETLNDLRRIWQWPPVHRLKYPGQDWFDKHGTTPIAELADDEE